jgi:hypothetical protein
MRNYRNAFLFALVGNLVFVGILAAIWWRTTHQKKSQSAMQTSSNETAASTPNDSESAEMAPHEVALAPVRLSPERMQSIGARMGRVERKVVSDEIRVTGNVASDETRLAYVQVR